MVEREWEIICSERAGQDFTPFPCQKSGPWYLITSQETSSAKRTRTNDVCLVFLISVPENTSIIGVLKGKAVTTISRVVVRKLLLLVWTRVSLSNLNSVTKTLTSEKMIGSYIDWVTYVPPNPLKPFICLHEDRSLIITVPDARRQ